MRHGVRDARRSRVAGSVLLTMATACAVAGAAVPASAGPRPGAVASRSAAAASSGVVRRTVTVAWHRSPAGKGTRSTRIPGIGRVALSCSPHRTQISIRPTDRDAETQMWLAKYQDKSYGRSVAVKTVRVYRFDHRGDDGRGGSGATAHEGLNIGRGKHGVENWANGYAHGIISQRPGRDQDIGDAPRVPATTFSLTWYWNDFDYPPRFRSCRMRATFLTRPGKPLGLDWHGRSDAAGRGLRKVPLGDLGDLVLRCGPYSRSPRSIAIVPARRSTSWYAEVVQGEGRVEDHVEIRRRDRDPETGLVGPMTLPRNGMVRVFVKTAGRTVPYLVSSYAVQNDPHDSRDLCEIAVGAFPR